MLSHIVGAVRRFTCVRERVILLSHSSFVHRSPQAYYSLLAFYELFIVVFCNERFKCPATIAVDFASSLVLAWL